MGRLRCRTVARDPWPRRALLFGTFLGAVLLRAPVAFALVLGTLVYRTVGPAKLAHMLYGTGRFAAIALFCIGTASAFGWLLACLSMPSLPVVAGCLVIACAIGEIRVAAALRDVFVILAPMLLVLIVVILFPDLVLFPLRLIVPRFVDWRHGTHRSMPCMPCSRSRLGGARAGTVRAGQSRGAAVIIRTAVGAGPP